MLTETELLQDIEAFCKLHTMPETTFGSLALADFNFVDDLRTKARSPKLKTVKKVVEFMKTYTPEKK